MILIAIATVGTLAILFYPRGRQVVPARTVDNRIAAIMAEQYRAECARVESYLK